MTSKASTKASKSQIRKNQTHDSYSAKEAQDRFERAVDIAISTKPLHKRTTKGRKK
jgi:hypothetical protein